MSGRVSPEESARRDAIVLREFPNKSFGEIVNEFGIPKTTIQRIVKRLGVVQTQETKERLHRLSQQEADRLHTKEVRAKVSEGVRRARRKHKLFIKYDLESPYHYPPQTMPRNAYSCKMNIIYKRGYYRDSEPYVIRYDENTKRTSYRPSGSEEYMSKKYGFKFLPL